ncbi:MAG: terpene cyclase/mutase family protein [Methanobacteriota archaeon]|nr:MAG: terpene cyclase/mutase family protein [Euryarchaeota archaeon]
MGSRSVLDWLLEEEQPAVRYLTLTQLLRKPNSDPEVVAAREKIPSAGWASSILWNQSPDGTWVGRESLYQPKYLSTNWMLLVLSDLGLTNADPRIAKSCEIWIDRFARPDGGFAMDGSKKGHLCTTGNMARALVRFGYVDHPKVTAAFEWLAETRDKKGGWSCFGTGRNLDSWEGMSAFAVYPKPKWTAEMTRAVELGAEFYLERELHRQGDHYEPWYRFHYPVHYYYDLLVGLDFMTALGYGDEPRMRHAIDHLKSKRRSDGRWNLDAIHPDAEGGVAEWYESHPKHRPTPFALEKAGEPSKMITLRALLVLDRLTETG